MIILINTLIFFPQSPDNFLTEVQIATGDHDYREKTSRLVCETKESLKNIEDRTTLETMMSSLAFMNDDWQDKSGECIVHACFKFSMTFITDNINTTIVFWEVMMCVIMHLKYNCIQPKEFGHGNIIYKFSMTFITDNPLYCFGKLLSPQSIMTATKRIWS